MPGRRTDSSWLVYSAPVQTPSRGDTSACRHGATSPLGSAAGVGSLAAAIIIHQLINIATKYSGNSSTVGRPKNNLANSNPFQIPGRQQHNTSTS